MSSENFATGDKVEWDWGDGTGSGTIRTVHTADVTVTIKNTQVHRNASGNCPAYTIEQDDGDTVLKSHSEIRAMS